MIRELKNYKTNIAEDAVVMETGLVIGNVELKSKANIWFGAVLRGDRDKIVIGEYTNIQDNCTVHTSMGYPAVIGDNCVVGHGAILHGCKVENNCLIGIGATLLDGCKIGENSIVAAGTLIPEGKVIPPNSLAMGNPYKIKRKVSDEEIKNNKKVSIYYYEEVAALYK